jgi:hypothetical protein
LLIIGFVLKTVDIVHVIIQQANIDVFFIDWERTTTGPMTCSQTAILAEHILEYQLITSDRQQTSVSAWRTCFIANEFNQMQTFRRVRVSFQLLLVVFIIKVR